MAVEIVQLLQDVLTIKVTGGLNELEIDQLQAAATQAVARWKKFRVLIMLEDFDGWAGAPRGTAPVSFGSTGRPSKKSQSSGTTSVKL